MLEFAHYVMSVALACVNDMMWLLTLLDLTGVWLARTRASLAVVFHARSLNRAWSRAIYDALPQVDGLLYRSTMTGRYCAALYERSLTSLPATPELDVALDDPRLTGYLARAAVELDYAME